MKQNTIADWLDGRPGRALGAAILVILTFIAFVSILGAEWIPLAIEAAYVYLTT